MKSKIIGILLIFGIVILSGCLNSDNEPESYTYTGTLGSGYSSSINSTCYTESFSSVTDDVKYEIRSDAELSGTNRVLKLIKIDPIIHSTKTPADYEGMVCSAFWDTTLIGSFSIYNTNEISFPTI